MWKINLIIKIKEKLKILHKCYMIIVYSSSHKFWLHAVEKYIIIINKADQILIYRNSCVSPIFCPLPNQNKNGENG